MISDDDGHYRIAQLSDRPSLFTAAALLLLLMAFARPSDAEATRPPVAPPPSLPVVLSSPSPRANDGGTLRIVEQGFTTSQDPTGEHQVRWGLIVENTSRTSAGAVPMTVDILDAKGRQLVTKTSDYARHRRTAYIMPGARFGLGDDTYVKRGGAAKVSIKLGRPEWLPPTDRRAPRLTARLVKGDLHLTDKKQLYLTGSPVRAEAHRTRRYDLSITFRVDSGATEVLADGKASAILRDTHGRIVGGTHPADTTTWTRFPPGWSIQRIDTTGVPSTVDVTRIEVYPQPSYF